MSKAVEEAIAKRESAREKPAPKKKTTSTKKAQ